MLSWTEDAQRKDVKHGKFSQVEKDKLREVSRPLPAAALPACSYQSPAMGLHAYAPNPRNQPHTLLARLQAVLEYAADHNLPGACLPGLRTRSFVRLPRTAPAAHCACSTTLRTLC